MLNNCKDETYNELPGWRMTDLKRLQTIDGCEEEYVHRYLQPRPESDSPAMAFGTSLHNWLLMGEKDFLFTDKDLRTKAGKEAKAKAEEQGLRLVKDDEHQRLVNCFEKGTLALANDYPQFNGTQYAELALQGNYKDLPLKVKLDLWREGDVIDLKTISQWPHEGQFLRHIDKYGYDLSACGYINVARQEGLEVNRYRWLFVESVWPHRCRWVDCPEWLLENTWGRLELCYERALTLDQFKPPADVALEPEQWWLFKYGEQIALEGAEIYEE